MQRFARVPRLRGSIAGLGAAFGVAFAVPPLLAAEGQLTIELNKLEDTEEGCRSLFVVDNETGHELHRFRLDLILFDPEGVYAKQLLLDLAPLYEDKKVVASFLLAEDPCASLGSILINDVPWCENGAGATIDCVKQLEVRSRSDVPLEK
ncbi:MAG: Tat pathway signal sequence domain protein [Geminicoccaceae bacterium]